MQTKIRERKSGTSELVIIYKKNNIITVIVYSRCIKIRATEKIKLQATD